MDILKYGKLKIGSQRDFRDFAISFCFTSGFSRDQIRNPWIQRQTHLPFSHESIEGLLKFFFESSFSSRKSLKSRLCYVHVQYEIICRAFFMSFAGQVLISREREHILGLYQIT